MVAKKYLSELDLFKTLPQEVIGQIALTMHSISCNAGKYLYRRGDIATCMYLQRTGEAKLRYLDGTPSTRLKRGDVVGERSVIAGKRRYDVYCTIWTEFFVLPIQDIQTVFRTNFKPKRFKHEWNRLKKMIKDTSNKSIRIQRKCNLGANESNTSMTRRVIHELSKQGSTLRSKMLFSPKKARLHSNDKSPTADSTAKYQSIPNALNDNGTDNTDEDGEYRSDRTPTRSNDSNKRYSRYNESCALDYDYNDIQSTSNGLWIGGEDMTNFNVTQPCPTYHTEFPDINEIKNELNPIIPNDMDTKEEQHENINLNDNLPQNQSHKQSHSEIGKGNATTPTRSTKRAKTVSSTVLRDPFTHKRQTQHRRHQSENILAKRRGSQSIITRVGTSIDNMSKLPDVAKLRNSNSSGSSNRSTNRQKSTSQVGFLARVTPFYTRHNSERRNAKVLSHTKETAFGKDKMVQTPSVRNLTISPTKGGFRYNSHEYADSDDIDLDISTDDSVGLLDRAFPSSKKPTGAGSGGGTKKGMGKFGGGKRKNNSTGKKSRMMKQRSIEAQSTILRSRSNTPASKTVPSALHKEIAQTHLQMNDEDEDKYENEIELLSTLEEKKIKRGMGSYEVHSASSSSSASDDLDDKEQETDITNDKFKLRMRKDTIKVINENTNYGKNKKQNEDDNDLKSIEMSSKEKEINDNKGNDT